MSQSISLARRLGRTVALAHRQHVDPVAAVLQAYGSGHLLFRGKVRSGARPCRGGGGAAELSAHPLLSLFFVAQGKELVDLFFQLPG